MTFVRRVLINRSSQQATRRWCSSSPLTNNYFDILGIERRFAIPPAVEMKKRYHSLMEELHPDRHVGSDDQEIKAEEASRVTLAYDILTSPHARAVHLLELLGKPMDETISGDLVGMPFLMDLMELREEIAETTEDELLQSLKEDNRKRISGVETELEAAFEKDELQEALVKTAELQYWNRVEETIRDKIE